MPASRDCLNRMRQSGSTGARCAISRGCCAANGSRSLHSHLYHANLYGRIAAFLAGVPAVATVHNVYARRKLHRKPPQQVAVAGQRARDRGFWRHPRRPGEARWHRPGKAFRSSTMASTCAGSNTDLTREQARARLGIPGDELLIGCVGRLEEQKGHRFLLEACATLKNDPGNRLRARSRRRPPAAGSRAPCGRARLGRERIVSRHAPRRRRNPAGTGHLCHALALGRPVDRDAGSDGGGLPLVISDVSGAAQAFGDNECGILVPPGDVAALAQALASRSPGNRAADAPLGCGTTARAGTLLDRRDDVAARFHL